MLTELRTGPVVAQEGTVNPARSGRFGDLLLNSGVGKYYEGCKQGAIFTASMQTGAALGTAFTLTVASIWIYNPSGSGINVAILQGVIAHSTNPAGATVRGYFWVVNPDPAAVIPVTNTTLTAQPALLGSGYAARARAFTVSTLPSTPVAVRVFPLAYRNVVTTASSIGPIAAIDYVDGAICLAPNTGVGLQGIVGTATSGFESITWAEIPA